MAKTTVGGVSNFSINGISMDVAGEAEVMPNIDERTTMKGLTGVQGFSVEPAPGKITVTIRDSSALGVEYFNTLEDADVVVEFRNGKTWIGTGMWQVGEVGVTAKESEIKLTLEGPDVTETGATGATAP